MSGNGFPAFPDELNLDEEDRALLGTLRELVQLGDEMPPEVAQAAKGLHDWARLDAELAELIDSELELTRAEDGVLVWGTQGVEIRVEVSPAGYQRRQLCLLATENDLDAAVDLAVQTSDGSSVWVSADAFGERITRVPSGAVRVLARTPSQAVVTPWFTV